MKNGWRRQRLGDFAASVSTGPFGSLLHKSDYVDDGVPLVNPVNIVGDRIAPDPTKLIDEATKERLSSYVLSEGDIVVGRRGEIGRCAVIGPDESGWICGTGSFFIRPLPSINSQFLAHLIRSDAYREKLEHASTGSTMKNLSNTALADLLIAVPPLHEQQRIVGILEEAFDGIATAKANAEKNLQNARAIFESHLQSVFTQRGAAWVEKQLGDFCRFENGDRGTNYPSKSARTATGVPFINAGHLTEDGIDLQHMDYISRERFDLLSNGKIRDGDVLFCLRGSLGKFASVGDLSEGAIASSLVIVRPDKTVLNEFVVAYFRSQLCAEMINRFKNGAAQPNLSAQSLRKFIVPVPPPQEQKAVVERLTELHEETQRLESVYRHKLAALVALKKALLHQAFAGDL